MQNQSKRLFRTNNIQLPPQGVDRGTNTIRGAVVIEAGPLNDARPWIVDEATLGQVVVFGNRPKRGLKARFTHPDICNDGLGRYLGRWHNFRFNPENPAQVLADLKLAAASFDTPHGDLGGYVLNLAEEDPDAFGVSISAVLADEMFADPADPAQQIEPEDSPEPLPLRLESLYSADIVDEPAATRGGLFEQSKPDLATLAGWTIRHYFPNATPAEIMGRCQGLIARHFGLEEQTLDETHQPAEQAADIVTETDDRDGHGTRDTAEQAEQETPAAEQTEQAEQETPADLEAEAEQQAHEETETPTAPAEQATPAEQFMRQFGDRGARWFLEGRNYVDCLTTVLAEAQAERDSLAGQVAALSERLKVAEIGAEVTLSRSNPLSPRDQIRNSLKGQVTPAAAALAAHFHDKV